MSFITKLEPLTNIYDMLHHAWEHPRGQRRVAVAILLFYLCTMLAIELNRNGLLPPSLAAITPVNHFHAISMSFTFILGLELMSLILSLSSSLSRSMGKQLEILALILLRNAFKELSYLPEPVSLAGDPTPILRIATDGAAALGIFVCVAVYSRLKRHQGYITDPEERMSYVMSKKLMALTLFCAFVGIGVRDAWIFFSTGQECPFFETIYTVLIFADIALVLVAQRFMPSFHAVFRNSSFVIGTLIMRLSLSVAWPWDAVASLFAAVYILALTWITTHFTPERAKGRKTPA